MNKWWMLGGRVLGQGRLPGGGVGCEAEKLSLCVAGGFPMELTPTSLARQGPTTAMDTTHNCLFCLEGHDADLTSGMANTARSDPLRARLNQASRCHDRPSILSRCPNESSKP